MSGVFKWAAVGLAAGAPAAFMAYTGGPIARGALAAWAAVVIVAVAMRLDRHLSGVRAKATRTAKDVGRIRGQNDTLRASVRELKAENAALRKQLKEARTHLDRKIALAVERISTRLAYAIRDSEVESGLDALNRYIALATPPANVLGDDDSSHDHPAT